MRDGPLRPDAPPHCRLSRRHSLLRKSDTVQVAVIMLGCISQYVIIASLCAIVIKQGHMHEHPLSPPSPSFPVLVS